VRASDCPVVLRSGATTSSAECAWPRGLHPERCLTGWPEKQSGHARSAHRRGGAPHPQ
jgi:hypothetical protein